MKQITSEQNKTFKLLESLLHTRNIKKQQQFLVFDQKLLQENLTSSVPKPQLTALIYPENTQDPFLEVQLPKYLLTQELFKKLDIFNFHQPIGLYSSTKLTHWSPALKFQEPVVLLPLGDPLNLGASLRNLRAFDIKNVVLLQESAHPFHPKTLISGRGASLNLNLMLGPSIQSLDVPLLTLDSHGQDMTEFQWPAQFQLLVGEEGPGLPENKNFQKLSIPISDQMESLNAMAALSIAIFHYRTQHPLVPTEKP